MDVGTDLPWTHYSTLLALRGLEGTKVEEEVSTVNG